MAPNVLATASYDGEIVIWNTNSEHSSRHLQQRMRKKAKSRSNTFVTKTREVGRQYNKATIQVAQWVKRLPTDLVVPG